MGQINDFSKSPLFAIIFKKDQIRDISIKIYYTLYLSILVYCPLFGVSSVAYFKWVLFERQASGK